MREPVQEVVEPFPRSGRFGGLAFAHDFDDLQSIAFRDLRHFRDLRIYRQRLALVVFRGFPRVEAIAGLSVPDRWDGGVGRVARAVSRRGRWKPGGMVSGFSGHRVVWLAVMPTLMNQRVGKSRVFIRIVPDIIDISTTLPFGYGK